MVKKLPTISEQLRAAIDASGQTRYRIAQETGIDESRLGKFYHGKLRLGQNAIDALGEYLGLELTTRTQPKRKGK